LERTEVNQFPKKHQPPFIPFNYGKRTCLGQGMAYLEVKIVLCMLVQAGIDLVLKDGFKPHYLSAITISVKDGMWMVPSCNKSIDGKT